jgi:hypothetical protein
MVNLLEGWDGYVIPNVPSQGLFAKSFSTSLKMG